MLQQHVSALQTTAKPETQCDFKVQNELYVQNEQYLCCQFAVAMQSAFHRRVCGCS